MIKLMTSGESHGKALSVIIEGIPAGLEIDPKFINNELSRRQKGYGRGTRMKIESDKAEILSGVRFGETIGSPISIQIRNKDFENWKDIMKTGKGSTNKKITSPRPGHADLPGVFKYGRTDIRDILERASARDSCLGWLLLLSLRTGNSPDSDVASSSNNFFWASVMTCLGIPAIFATLIPNEWSVEPSLIL